MKFKGLLLGLLLLAASPAFAADIDGQWAGSIDTPNGPVQVSYTFKAAGHTLTGSTAGPDGTVIAIKDGKIDGANVSFSIDLNLNGTLSTLKYTGVLAAGSLALKTEFMGQAMNFTVKKAG